MASNIKFKRSAVQNRVPTTAQLDLGELALNTYDGKLYTEINTGSAAVIEIGSKLSSLVVDGANGGGGGDVVFHGTTAGKDLTWDYSDNSLKLVDGVNLKLGSSADLEVFHDGNVSRLRHNHSGTDLVISNAGFAGGNGQHVSGSWAAGGGGGGAGEAGKNAANPNTNSSHGGDGPVLVGVLLSFSLSHTSGGGLGFGAYTRGPEEEERREGVSDGAQ